MKQLLLFLVALLVIKPAAAQVTPVTNTISVDITLPENASFDYPTCFALGDNAGMGTVGLFQTWTMLEPTPMSYDMALMDIADWFYPMNSMPVDLTIAPIATNQLEVPSDLTSTAFDSPAMISRFNTMLDTLRAHLPNLVLSSLVIGSEHDIYMGSNATLWSQYTTFYDSVSAHAKTLWPGLKVATELTYPGMVAFNTYAQTLNTVSDYIGVSYYPLNNDFTVKPVSVIPTDLATVVSLYPSKPICYYQYGYPSSTTCNSSQTMQEAFITQTFTSWDTYAGNIKMIDFTWLHDMDSATVAYYSSYYGISDPVFLEYLHTLGLREWNGNGTDKPAWVELQCQAKARGFNSLPISCSSAGIKEEQTISFDLYPNPASDQLEIRCDGKFGSIRIYDSTGQLVLSSTQNSVNLHELANGIYYLSLDEGKGKCFVINR